MNKLVFEKDNLPNGWIETNIGTICHPPQYGWTTAASKIGKVKLLRTTDITSGDVDWKTVPFCKQVPEQLEKYLLKKNDVVVSRAGSIGVSYLLDDVSNTVFASYLIRFRSMINHSFFYYFLQSGFYWQSIYDKKIGIAVPNVNATKLKQVSIPLPPLNEQKRIVTKLESIFSQIDAKQRELMLLHNKMKSVPDSMNMLKSSILRQAFEGKLVPQDLNDEPAELLLSRIHKDSKKELVFEKYDSPSGWIRVLLSDIAQINPPKPAKNSISDRLEVSFVPMRNVEALNGKIDLSETREYVKVRTGYTYFQNDDIIFAKITPCMENGKVAIVTGLKNGIGFGSTEFHVIRLKSEMLRKFYFLYFVQSDFRYNAQHKMKGTAGQLRVPSDYMKNILVPLPPLNEQKRIATKIESIFDKIDAKQKELELLASKIKSVLDTVSALKVSILKQAFEGKLVSQDPNDEPASTLLERIKLEKTGTTNRML